jgi:hypothetical protein
VYLISPPKSEGNDSGVPALTGNSLKRKLPLMVNQIQLEQFYYFSPPILTEKATAMLNRNQVLLNADGLV